MKALFLCTCRAGTKSVGNTRMSAMTSRVAGKGVIALQLLLYGMAATHVPSTLPPGRASTRHRRPPCPSCASPSHAVGGGA
jgi:hypothetical protein